MGLYHIYFWDIYEGPGYIFVDCLTLTYVCVSGVKKH